MNSPLVDVTELQQLLARDEPPLVLDLRYYLGQPGRGEQEYLDGHLPGSIFVDVEEVFSGPVRPDRAGGRHPLPGAARLQEGLRAAGIDRGRPLVLLDQGNAMGAGRGWWVLADAGITDVRVLDGGLAAWRTAGLPLTSELPDVKPGTIEITTTGLAPQVDAVEIPGVLESGGRVVDVRAAERYRGESEHIDPVAGHIPGAINLPAGQLQQPDGRFLPADQLAAVLADVRPGDVLSCGSGITAAMVALAAEQAGIHGVRLYPGSWSDWISDPTRPVATGQE